MRVLVEERRTRVSLVVKVVEAGGLNPTVREGVTLSLAGRPQQPTQNTMGSWVFEDVPAGAHTLTWRSGIFEDGSQPVDLAALPPLHPVVEIEVTRRGGGG